MRTIKFRGKRIDNAEWIYGNLIEQYTHESNYVKVGFAIQVKEGNSFVSHDVYPETVGQLTGMAGKDAKLIFEGDLIRISEDKGWYAKENPENIGVVTWGRGNYFSNGTFCEYNVYAWLHSIEVVGNIHDNSDLLPKTKYLKTQSYINGEFYCSEKEKGIHACRKQCFSCERLDESKSKNVLSQIKKGLEDVKDIQSGKLKPKSLKEFFDADLNVEDEESKQE